MRNKIDLFVFDVDRYMLQSEFCHVAFVKLHNFLNNVTGCLIENCHLSVVYRNDVVGFYERQLYQVLVWVQLKAGLVHKDSDLVAGSITRLLTIKRDPFFQELSSFVLVCDSNY